MSGAKWAKIDFWQIQSERTDACTVLLFTYRTSAAENRGQRKQNKKPEEDRLKKKKKSYRTESFLRKKIESHSLVLENKYKYWTNALRSVT